MQNKHTLNNSFIIKGIQIHKSQMILIIIIIIIMVMMIIKELVIISCFFFQIYLPFIFF
jgi:hypothetical protein